MKEKRVYGKSIDINEGRIKFFYDNRAKAVKNMSNHYVAVLLGDQNPEYALAWDKFETEHILPKMQIDGTARTLDIGCGIGRWAEKIIPRGGYYCGTDVSAEMIKCARERNQFPGKTYDFFNYGFEKLCTLPKEQLPCKFNRLVICGVMMYVNDEVVRRGMEQLLGKMDGHAKVYFAETIALEERLTLDGFYSEALKTDYDAIYRTAAEYNRIYKSWLDTGFRIVEQGTLPYLYQEKEFRETDRWYTLLER